jgi:hypothetical protein
MDLHLTQRVLARHVVAATGTPEEQLLRARLGRIADTARRLMEDARHRPQMPMSAIVEDLRMIVDEAEY